MTQCKVNVWCVALREVNVPYFTRYKVNVSCNIIMQGERRVNISIGLDAVGPSTDVNACVI